LSQKTAGVQDLLPEDRVNSATAFLSAARPRERGLDIIAITDHNRCRTACEIASSAPEGVLVLPGVEISIQCAELTPDCIHLVAVFPPEMASEDIDKVFADSGMSAYDRRDASAKVTRLRVADLLERIHGIGGIRVAAHVNLEGGIREYVRTTNIESLTLRREIARLAGIPARSEAEERRLHELQERHRQVDTGLQEQYLRFLSEAKFEAVEIQKPEDVRYYSAVHCSPLGIKPIACLLSSDAHCARDAGMRGHTTYLKMGELSFEGIRRALLDPTTRIRFEEERVPGPVIRGIQFRAPGGGEGGGFFAGETVGFSDDLTCVIGGRGSGKSALIEALRFAFMLPLDRIEDQRLRHDVERRREKTLARTEVRVLLEPSGQEPLVLRREYTETESAPSSLHQLNGNQLELDIRSASYGRVQLFGWSEIEAVATDPAKQRDLLDSFIPTVHALKLTRSQAFEALRSNKADILAKIRLARSLMPKIVPLDELRIELRSIDTAEMQEVFVEVDSAQRQELVIANAASGVGAIEARFRDEQERQHDVKSAMTRCFSGAVAALESQGLDVAQVESRRHELEVLAEAAGSAYAQLISVLGQFRAILDQERSRAAEAGQRGREQLLQKAQGIYREQLNAGTMTEEEVVERVGKRNELKVEVDKLEAVKKELDQLRGDADAALCARWERLVPELRNARRAISAQRSRKAEEINDALRALGRKVRISVTMIEDGDRSTFAMRLGADEREDPGLLHNCRIGNFRIERIPSQLSGHLLPREFARAVIERNGDGLVVPPTEGRSGVNEAQAARIIEHLSPFAEDGWYDVERLGVLLDLQELDVEDRPVISLDDVPIEDLSPGQRCTALVPVILLQGDEPLVIDQPEDNLDNRLVFDVVVDVLRSLKARRQVIVATHNPNIPVSGDAEQIVVLEASSGAHGGPKVQGCIDQDDVIQQVTDIMEGSKEAFELRAVKYNYEITPLPKAV
jgi:DNA repair ATPase RecN